MLWRSVRRNNSSSVEHHLRRTAGDCSRGDGTSDSTLRVEERVVTGPLLRVRVCHKGAAVTRFQSESFVHAGAHERDGRCSHRHLCGRSLCLSYFLQVLVVPL